jgi:hypothetical protein
MRTAAFDVDAAMTAAAVTTGSVVSEHLCPARV